MRKWALDRINWRIISYCFESSNLSIFHTLLRSFEPLSVDYSLSMYRESEKRDHVNMAQFERICTRNKLRTSVKQIIPSQVSTRMATNTTVILAIFMTVVTSVTVGRLHGKLNILVLLITIFLLFQGHVTGSSFNSILSRMFMFLHSTWGGESF